MKKKKRIGVLYLRLLSCFVLLAWIPLIFINQYWSRKTQLSFEATARDNAAQLANQTVAAVENNLNNLNTIALSVIFDENINQIIRVVYDSEEERKANISRLSDKLQSARSLDQSLLALTIISKDMDYAVSSAGERLHYDALFAENWYKDFVRSGTTAAITGFHSCDYIDRVNSQTFTILKRFTADRSNIRTGFLIMEVFASPIMNTFNNALSDGASIAVENDEGFFHVKGDGNVCRYVESEPIDSGIVGTDGGALRIQGVDHIVVRYPIKTGNWNMFLILSRNVLYREAIIFQRGCLWMTVGVALLTAFVAAVLARRILRPILALSAATEQVRSGNLDIQVPVTTTDEVGRMSDDFNAMIIHIRNLLQSTRASEKAKYEAEVRALQAQINPHFLYNTLNVIRWLAMMKDTEKIEKMVVDLVRLLEYTKDENGILVPIGSEAEHLRHYAELMSIRYEDRFDFILDVDPEALQYCTIRFTLQPLVENAIFHGIDPMDRKGTVRVSIQKNDERITFRVEDDGVGVDLRENEHRFFSGMGITNVNERLVTQLGAECALQISSEVGKGTRIVFSIPAIKAMPVHEMEGAI